MNTSSKKPDNKSKKQIVDELIEITRFFDCEPQEYIEEYLYIKTKDQRIVPLKLNTAQKLIYQKIREVKAKGKPIRIIILKARQEGVSTLCEGLIFERPPDTRIPTP